MNQEAQVSELHLSYQHGQAQQGVGLKLCKLMLSMISRTVPGRMAWHSKVLIDTKELKHKGGHPPTTRRNQRTAMKSRCQQWGVAARGFLLLAGTLFQGVQRGLWPRQVSGHKRQAWKRPHAETSATDPWLLQEYAESKQNTL